MKLFVAQHNNTVQVSVTVFGAAGCGQCVGHEVGARCTHCWTDPWVHMGAEYLLDEIESGQGFDLETFQKELLKLQDADLQARFGEEFRDFGQDEFANLQDAIRDLENIESVAADRFGGLLSAVLELVRDALAEGSRLREVDLDEARKEAEVLAKLLAQWVADHGGPVEAKKLLDPWDPPYVDGEPVLEWDESQYTRTCVGLSGSKWAVWVPVDGQRAGVQVDIDGAVEIFRW